MNEKIKKGINKKAALGAMSVAFLVAFIAVASFGSFIMDPSGWQTAEFLSDEIIIVAITIFAMVSFTFIGGAGNAQDPRSEIAKARSEFSASVRLVQDTRAFKCWCRDVLEKSDMRNAMERELAKVGVDDPSVVELEIQQIKALDLPQKYGDRFYKGLTPKQMKAVIRLKDNPPISGFVDPSYYLSAKSVGGNATISEQAGREGQKKSALMVMSIISKAIVTVMLSMILGSFVLDVSQGYEAAAAWGKFIQRMFTLVSSSFMGYMVGCQSNDIDAYYVGLRVETIREFLNDKAYRPVSQQEEARKAFAAFLSSGVLTSLAWP